MESWYLMGSLPVFNSGFEQEEFDDYATKGFSELLDSPISCIVQVYDKVLKTWSDMKCIIQNNSTDSENQTDIRQILSVIGTLKIGMYIKYKSNIWLIISFPDDNKIYDKAILRKCNYTLPFQTTSSTIIQEPCIVLTQSEYTSGENQGNIITLSDSQRAILIQYNENTKYLVEQNRLFIDQLCDKPKVYKITKADRIYYMNGTNGLLKLTCDEDQTTDKDDISLKIADYISTTPSPTPVPTTLGVSAIANTKNVVYTTSVDIKVGSTGTSAKPFVAKFFDTSKTEIFGLQSKWSLVLNSNLTDKVTLTYNATYPDRCYVNVSNDSSLIGSSFTLELVDANSLYGKCAVTCNITPVYG